MKSSFLHILIFALLTMSTGDRLLNVQSQRMITLRDGTSVTLLNDVNEPGHYYYLPRTVQISRNKGLPEISLMVYRNDRNEITGGILHVLMKWGLTPEQEQETQKIITEKIDSLGTLKGAGEISFDPQELQFDQDNVFSKGLERSSSGVIKIPTLSIHKTAASFNLSPIVARFLVDEIRAIDQSDDIRIKASYRYNVASGDDFVKTQVELTGEAHITLSEWIKALKQYNLIKHVRV